MCGVKSCNVIKQFYWRILDSLLPSFHFFSQELQTAYPVSDVYDEYVNKLEQVQKNHPKISLTDAIDMVNRMNPHLPHMEF